jgi:hypothetical protein
MSDTHGKRGISLVVNSAEAEAQSRLSAMRLVSLTLRLMERWRGLVEDNDCAMIMMAVALINTESLTRTKLVEHGIADIKNGVPPNLLRKCNISSVALATGLNRETTRRKVAHLIKRGFLARAADGHVYLEPELGIRGVMAQTVRSQLETFAKAANEFLRDGTLKLLNDPESPAQADGGLSNYL